jgi:hypothetical protein
MADALKSLVVFAVVLALVGTGFAGMYYFNVDLPQQKAVKPPTNGGYKQDPDGYWCKYCDGKKTACWLDTKQDPCPGCC